MSDEKTAFVKSVIDNRIIVRKAEELVLPPKVIFVNKFTEESAKKFAIEMSAAEDTNQSIIPVYIDSYGGYVDALIHMMEVIRSCKTPVATICIGKAMSCGALLLSQGVEGHRYMGASSRVMIHEVSSGTHGKVEEIKADVNETDRLNKMVYKWMANNTGHADDYFMKLTHEKNHADWFLTADECKSHNLVNHLRIPKFTINVKVDIEFQ
jgi:ATP-dependent Clp protease protease subunit